MTPAVRNSAFILLVAALALAWCVLPGGAQGDKKPKPLQSPLAPEEAVKHFQLSAGLRIELVACEPQIESPVAMAFDEDGRLWVVEMRDYPNGPKPGQPPQGRIRLLEDRDGDGRYETSSVFADNLLFANGVLPWRGGLLVTAAPYIIHLRDTDGDGKADQREVLYEGFATQNPQLRVSHPNLGIDNWIYVANGLRGGQVRRAGKADAKPINLSGMDFRFDLIHDRAEAISGMGQYGNTFDDWGNRFVCDNRHHLRHVVMPNHYLKRNPYLAAPAVMEDISELEVGLAGGGARIYPLSSNWTTSNLHAATFTAACSVFIYRGGLLGPRFKGSAFTCDPTGNLVHQEILEPHGATFRSRPPEKGKEFLASPDDWFRPVFLTHGPDGALYVVDMYRAVIEHPEFMPPELKNRPDLTLGKDRGRIWRIVPADHKTKTVQPKLSKATTAELVTLLEHDDAWWRTTAQRLLLERQDKAAIEPLRKLVFESKSPLARVHAAWLLDSFGSLNELTILKLMGDEHPRVRQQAPRLAEMHKQKNKLIKWGAVRLSSDKDLQVRFQMALTIGELDDAFCRSLLAEIARQGAGDRWTRLAVASAVPQRAGELLRLMLSTASFPFDPRSTEQLILIQELSTVVGARADADEVGDLLKTLQWANLKEPTWWRLVALHGLADGMGSRGKQLGEFLMPLKPQQRYVVDLTMKLLAGMAILATDGKRELPDRLAAVRLLAHVSWDTAQPALTTLLKGDQPQELRLAAVRALAAHPRPEVPALLLKSWRSYTPAVRREVTAAMLRQTDRILFLLREVEKGRIKPGDLDTTRSKQLVNHKNPDIRDLARKLLQQNLPADRKEVLERYRAALSLKGDPQRGRVVFEKNCATCHRVAGVGVDVGPDVSDTRGKTLEALLTDVLNPNQAIDSNYVDYVVTTKSGKSLTGLIATETASSITLKRAENQTETVLRSDIESIQSTGVSLMPEGLEKTITVQEMADLLHFLKNWRYLDGKVPVKGG